MPYISKIEWVIFRIAAIIGDLTVKLFIKKDNNMYLFGSKPAPFTKDYFLHNTKYMFLYMQNQPNIKTYWLCDDKKMLKTFHEKGFKNVIPRKSLKGIYAILKSKYWFNDGSANQITRFNSTLSNSIMVNFWHGAGGLKKVGDNGGKNVLNFNKGGIQDKIYHLLKNKDDYYIVNSDYEANCRRKAFGAKDSQLITIGSPRLDALFNDIKNSELFMEEDFNKIKDLKQQGKKIIIYMPTYRDTGKDVSDWLKSKRLQSILQDNNTILVCKLHPIDVNSLDFELPETIYKMDNEADIYPVLKYSDGLITDYSSIYFDYLLLDKPIIYHIPDIKEYTEQCRGFYRDYETLTAGVYTKTEDELLAAIQDVVNGVDNYKEQRKKLRDEMFVYQDGNNCKRNFEFVKGLEK